MTKFPGNQVPQFPSFSSHVNNASWFYGKKCKIGKGNLYLTENQLSRNEMWCVADIYNYMCNICAKGFLDSNLLTK